jgi:GH15 family glucan-1,4-alpha-glucosidase
VVDKSKAPFAEHPDFLETDLIAGRMDNQPDLITLDPSASMMSYRALLDAATIADRVGQSAMGKTWRSEAGKLQAAWEEKFKFVFATTPETYTTSLWPSGIGTSNRDVLTQELERRWNESHDANGSLRQPVSPFLNLAETHQWLVLDKNDRVWDNLQWFWQNQASPGLYTWWGDNNQIGELPKSFSQWHRYRGWINPPNVTPHYGSAAQMLLLQLDMLTYVDRSKSQPTLVIGAGIPKAWLKQPINVKGLQIGGSLVNWTWDGKQINLEIKGKKMNVQLGSAFPANTPVNLNPAQKTS